MDKQETLTEMVSVIIPAYNEARTIAHVIAVAKCHPNVDDVWVIDDGSTDGTTHIAKAAGVNVVTLAQNGGKAHAMDVGIKKTRHEIVCFLDADLLNFTEEMLDSIIQPVLTNIFDMFVGIRAWKIYRINQVLRITPIIGGERTLHKQLWYQLPNHCRKAFQIEIALNYHAKRYGKRMGFRILHGLQHVPKEKKRGFMRGLLSNIKMGWDMLVVGVKLYIINSSVERLTGKKAMEKTKAVQTP